MLQLKLPYKNSFYLKLSAMLPAFIVCLLFFSSTAYAERSFIKCWKNADGFTECGNRIPREYYSQRVRYIDEKGITRKVKERDKTREELESEKEIEKLLALEAEQQRKSKEYDDILLKTFLTIDDLLASLNSKLAIITSRSVILQSTIELKKREFSHLVRQAANMERSGKTISTKLAEKLDASRTDLRNIQSQITTEEQDTQRIKQTFAHDVELYMLTTANRIQHSLSIPSQAKKLHAVRLTCLTENQCDLQWQKANHFVKEFTTTKVLYETSKITVTDIPVKYQDIGMSLSLLESEKEKPKHIIFQIRCNREREGQEFCASGEVNGLLQEFKSVVYN